MKERPILFSAPMVRAILDGTKTQTRRVVKPRKDINTGCELSACELAGEVNNGDYSNSPYQVGDRLWVREGFMGWYNTADKSFSHVAAFRADGYELQAGERWTPSIHMPRAASRITLEITGVRVERLHDISEEDARAEGAPWAACGAPQEGGHRAGFADIWESINGRGSWGGQNPWVWVVEFKRLEGGAA